jgi:putative tryptophan/tyrosine transport system substrate-binding protein
VNRRALLALLASGSLLGVRFAIARTASHRLGIFIAGFCNAETREELAPMFKSLAELGHVEGRNLTVEWRCFGMDFSRAPSMAAELVRLEVDAIWTTGTPQTKALQDATKTIPIVTSVGDPVASGFAKTLVRPGGNITGLCRHPDTPAKQIELLRRVVPKLERLVIIGDARYTGMRQLLRPHEIAAKAAGLSVEVRMVDRSGFERVISEMKGFGAQAALIESPDFDMAEVARLANRHGVATMLEGEGDYVKHGGLISYDMFHGNFMQRSASLIDKVFRGMKPAEIPWELPDRSHLAINLGTAKLLGLTIPPDVLLRADQVVE